MKKKVILKISLFISLAVNLSFTWPVKDPGITSSFGESRGDHYHDGIDFISSDSSVHPAKKGKLLYLWDKSLFPTENYPGGGNYKILKHDEYCTIYMHLENNRSFKFNYSTDDVIGEIGNTGHSSGGHLHFSFLNNITLDSFNPLLLFPDYRDNQAPVIGNAYIRVDDNYFSIKNNEKIRLTKHYPLLLNIYDTITTKQGASRLGIYKLSVKLNGNTVLDQKFSEISFGKNGLTITGQLFQNLYDEKGYYKIPGIQYLDGINIIKIQASDLAGNIKNKQISFTVNLDIQ